MAIYNMQKNFFLSRISFSQHETLNILINLKFLIFRINTITIQLLDIQTMDRNNE